MSMSPKSQGHSAHGETGGEERKRASIHSESDEYRHQNFITQPLQYEEEEGSKIQNDFADMLGRQVEETFMEIQEKLLNQIYKLYRPLQEYGLRKNDRIAMLDTQVYGLEHIGKHMALIRGDASLYTFPESRKLNVMLIGNHSVGKSSYINWYLGEKLLKEGVAMETQGVHLVTSGAKYTHLKGQATLKAFPFLGKLIDEQTRKSKIPGLIESLTTTISPSRNRYFGSVNFIDTPGITDGALRYPFDMEKALVWMAQNAADLVLVFFDPIGQTLCKKTMAIVQKIDQLCPNKLHFFLSKADTITNQADRYKVLTQISQGLASSLRAKHAMEIPLIYIPKQQSKQSLLRTSKTFYERLPDMGLKVPNNIEDTAIMIYEQAGSKAERVLYKLKKDIDCLDKAVESSLFDNEHAADRFNRTKDCAILLKSIFLILALSLVFLILGQIGLIATVDSVLADLIILVKYEQSVLSFNKTAASFCFDNFFLFAVLCFILLSAFHRFVVKKVQLRSMKQRSSILAPKEYKRVRHYAEYLGEAMKLHRKWLNLLIAKTGIDRQSGEINRASLS